MFKLYFSSLRFVFRIPFWHCFFYTFLFICFYCFFQLGFCLSTIDDLIPHVWPSSTRQRRAGRLSDWWPLDVLVRKGRICFTEVSNSFTFNSCFLISFSITFLFLLLILFSLLQPTCLLVVALVDAWGSWSHCGLQKRRAAVHL